MADESMQIRDAARSGVHRVAGLVLSWAAHSDVGKVRARNEDAALVQPQMYVVADGMGGHDRGEVASETVLRWLGDVDVVDVDRTTDRIQQAISQAHAAIDEIEASDGRQAGTTVTGVALTDGDVPTWLTFNVGDSRTYRFHDQKLRRITTDHSHVQELIDAGELTPEQARVDSRRNMITRAVGAGIESDVDFIEFSAIAGDTLLMCSDGLTGELVDDDIAAILIEADNAAEAARRLVRAARKRGAHDNVTVVIVAVSAVDAGE